MDYVASAPPQSQDHPLLRRRSAVVVPPTMLTLLPHHNSYATTSAAAASSSSSSLPSNDLELLSIKPSSRSYTSLKDLLPSIAVNSPKPNQALPGSDIGIRNRLVKHAAWAYLQPMSTSSDSAAGNFFHRLWTRVAAFIDFVRKNIIQAIDETLRVIRIRGSR